MNCPYHRKRLVFIRRVGMFRWFQCRACRTTEWRAEDGKSGVRGFEMALRKGSSKRVCCGHTTYVIPGFVTICGFCKKVVR